MLIRLLVYSQVFKEFSFIAFTVCLRGRKRKGEKKVLVVWRKGKEGIAGKKILERNKWKVHMLK